MMSILFVSIPTERPASKQGKRTRLYKPYLVTLPSSSRGALLSPPRGRLVGLYRSCSPVCFPLHNIYCRDLVTTPPTLSAPSRRHLCVDINRFQFYAFSVSLVYFQPPKTNPFSVLPPSLTQTHKSRLHVLRLFCRAGGMGFNRTREPKYTRDNTVAR